MTPSRESAVIIVLNPRNSIEWIHDDRFKSEGMANRTKAMKGAAIKAAISSVPILGTPLVFLDSLADKLEEQSREEKMNALIRGIQGQL